MQTDLVAACTTNLYIQMRQHKGWTLSDNIFVCSFAVLLFDVLLNGSFQMGYYPVSNVVTKFTKLKLHCIN